MDKKKPIGYYFEGAGERLVIQVASAGVLLSALAMIWSNSAGVNLGYVTLLPYAIYRIAQLIRRSECRQDKMRAALAICIAALTLLNTFGLGQQMRFILALFGVEVWLYFRKSSVR